MQANGPVASPVKPGVTPVKRSFFARLIAQLRKLFGKKDAPNIYPFF